MRFRPGPCLAGEVGHGSPWKRSVGSGGPPGEGGWQTPTAPGRCSVRSVRSPSSSVPSIDSVRSIFT
eukprot:15443682-Alexandrium_andersonii.AAC.1